MKIVVIAETHQDERRVALVPDIAAKLVASGFEVFVQADAGEQAGFTDDAYREAGVVVEVDRKMLLSIADVVLSVQPPCVEDVAMLKEMDEINDEFKQVDVALVVGANDVVNPAARNSPGSDIYGMPILNADQARNVVILKRSMRPGFAGIDNELFYDHRTILLFGDAKESLTKLVAAVKAA